MASLISNGIINCLPELCVFVLNAKIGELLQKHIEPGAKPHFKNTQSSSSYFVQIMFSYGG